MRRGSWVVAVAVHAAILVGLARVPILAVTPPPAPEEVVVEMTNDGEPARSIAAPAEGAAGRSAAPSPRVRIASVDRPSAPSPVRPEGDAPPATDDTSVTIPHLMRGAPALGIAGEGANPFLPRSEAAVALGESRRAVDRALKDPAREHDQALGLGPEGPVLTALSEATARSTAPVRGKAIFVATADEGGVFQLELRDSEGSRAGWDDARNLALAALKGKRLRLPPGATRAVMRIEVKSDWKLPGGQDPGTNVDLFHVIPLAKGETKESTHVSILDPVPKIRVTELQIDKDVKVPIVSVELDLFSTNADPANLGARPRRVVHSHLVDAQVM